MTGYWERARSGEFPVKQEQYGLFEIKNCPSCRWIRQDTHCCVCEHPEANAGLKEYVTYFFHCDGYERSERIGPAPNASYWSYLVRLWRSLTS